MCVNMFGNSVKVVIRISGQEWWISRSMIASCGFIRFSAHFSPQTWGGGEAENVSTGSCKLFWLDTRFSLKHGSHLKYVPCCFSWGRNGQLFLWMDELEQKAYKNNKSSSFYKWLRKPTPKLRVRISVYPENDQGFIFNNEDQLFVITGVLHQCKCQLILASPWKDLM